MGLSIKEILQLRKTPNPMGEGLIIQDPEFSIGIPKQVGEIRAITPSGKAVVDIAEHQVLRSNKRGPHDQVLRQKTGRIFVDVNDQIFH